MSKLKADLHASQAAAGIERELETIRAGITRWNGIYLGALRNIQLKPHIESSLRQSETITIHVQGEDGDDEGEEERLTADLLPSPTEWTIASQVSVVLEPAYRATRHLQSLKTLPDRSYLLVFNLFKVRVFEIMKIRDSLVSLTACLISL